MKALILNSGVGHRMGELTSEHPKCMTRISDTDTILSRQLTQLADAGITEVVMTTGYLAEVLVEYCNGLDLPLSITFVQNPLYARTNYIYSIYCAKALLLDTDLLLMHGDLVLDDTVLSDLLACKQSCMKVSSTLALPQKDFKAVVHNGRVEKIGVDYFDHAMEAQALYQLKKADWNRWLNRICQFCEAGRCSCYAEDAWQEGTDRCGILAYDVGDRLCAEVDTPEDLAAVTAKLAALENRTVYLCFSTDILHSGHIALIRKAKRLGRLIVGILSDEAIASFQRFPRMPYEERKLLFENISGVEQVVKQETLGYAQVLRRLRPDCVVHGDDWREGVQQPIRDEVLEVLAEYGGTLVEFPYAHDSKYRELERISRMELSMPDVRRGRLRQLIRLKGCVTALEAHSGITGLIAETTTVLQDGNPYQFDAMWVSSLCDSTAKGKPDIELVDMTSRFRTIDDIMEVTTKPILFDGDTGGLIEHFVYTVRTLERMGVSMIIIEDKIGPKRNSLFGTEEKQTQDGIEHFCAKIAAGKRAQKTKDFMICARIESLILERGMDDALNRARAFVEAGADAVMIHSRKADPSEIQTFLRRFRQADPSTPIVLVPTAYHTVYEHEWKALGANVIIYANQLTRTGVPAMQHAARTILTHHRAKECDDQCMPIREIIRLIPGEGI